MGLSRRKDEIEIRYDFMIFRSTSREKFPFRRLVVEMGFSVEDGMVEVMLDLPSWLSRAV